MRFYHGIHHKLEKVAFQGGFRAVREGFSGFTVFHVKFGEFLGKKVPKLGSGGLPGGSRGPREGSRGLPGGSRGLPGAPGAPGWAFFGEIPMGFEVLGLYLGKISKHKALKSVLQRKGG